MPKFLIVMCIYGIFATVEYYCGALVGCPVHLETKTQERSSQ